MRGGAWRAGGDAKASSQQAPRCDNGDRAVTKPPTPCHTTPCHTGLSLWPPSFSAAIFDFDGTLAETWALWRRVDEIFFASRGLPFDEQASTTIATLGFAGGAQWCIGRYGLRDEVADVVDEWNRLGSALYETEVELRDGAERYLRALRGAGVRLALATTNAPEVLRSMRHVDVDALFDEVVCGCEVARGKDHPDIYLEAARRLDAAPADCVVFEDILPGVLSARRAGMRAVAVRCGDPRQSPTELQRAADLWINGWETLGREDVTMGTER